MQVFLLKAFKTYAQSPIFKDCLLLDILDTSMEPSVTLASGWSPYTLLEVQMEYKSKSNSLRKSCTLFCLLSKKTRSPQTKTFCPV
jgi:hypothetical protein